MRHLVNEKITLEGVTYKVLEYVDKDSGYQGAIYQRVDTGQIVVAHRGTEFGREFVRDGVLADGGMVATHSNREAPMPLPCPLTPVLSPAWRGRGGGSARAVTHAPMRG